MFVATDRLFSLPRKKSSPKNWMLQPNQCLGSGVEVGVYTNLG